MLNNHQSHDQNDMEDIQVNVEEQEQIPHVLLHVRGAGVADEHR